MTAYSTALKMLGRRELSAAQVRSRLADRGYATPDIDAALARLRESGAIDDARVARAYARTASAVKRRGRLRVAGELHAMGIDRDVVAEAVAEVFGAADDERVLIDAAIRKKMRGRQVRTVQERARLYQFLVRQGFTPAAVSAALRRNGSTDD